MLIDIQQKKQLIKCLSNFITEERLDLFYTNLKQRTNSITIVLEDMVIEKFLIHNYLLKWLMTQLMEKEERYLIIYLPLLKKKNY